MHTLQFDTHTEKTINQLAALAGKDADEFIKDVIQDFLAEQAETQEADAAYARYLAGQEKTVSLGELERLLGLES